MSAKKVSGKNHTKKQLDAWANRNNPNNKAYSARLDDHAKRPETRKKTHAQIHNAQRRCKDYLLPDWAPDYPDGDD